VSVPIADPVNTKIQMMVLRVIPAQAGIIKVKWLVLFVMYIHMRRVRREHMNRRSLLRAPIAARGHTKIKMAKTVAPIADPINTKVVMLVLPVPLTPFVHPVRINRQYPLLPRTVSVPIADPVDTKMKMVVLRVIPVQAGITKVKALVLPVMRIHTRRVHRESMNQQSLSRASIAAPEDTRIKMVKVVVNFAMPEHTLINMVKLVVPIAILADTNIKMVKIIVNIAYLANTKMKLVVMVVNFAMPEHTIIRLVN